MASGSPSRKINLKGLAWLPVAAGLLLAGCGSGGQPKPPAQAVQQSQPSQATAPAQGTAAAEPRDSAPGKPDFSLTLGKPSVSFTDTESPSEVPIHLASRNGLDLTQVKWRAEGLPKEVTAKFGEVTASGGKGSAVLSLQLTTMTASRGDYKVKIIAEGGGVTHTETLTVKVTRLSC